MKTTHGEGPPGGRRRGLAAAAAAGLLCAARPLRAQGRQKRISYLSIRRGPNEFEQAFLRGLREHGYVEGDTLGIDFRWAVFDLERVPAMVADALSLQPALVVVADAGGFVRAVKSTRPEMPIVVTAMADPIAQGLTQSLARPDGNVTGVSVFATELSRKRLELLKEAGPAMRRVGALYNAARRDNPPVGVAATVAAGRELGIDVAVMPVVLPQAIDAALDDAVRQGIQGLAIVSDTATITYREPLCEASLAHRLPAIFANQTYLKTRAGGLMSYGPDLEGAFHRAAFYVDRILRGTKPQDLPIEQPNRFELVLNQRVARTLGLAFSRALLIRADRVIE